MKFSMTEHGFETATQYGTLSISSNDEHGFRPYQLLVSAVAVCSGGVMKKVLEKMRMPAEDIQIDVKEVHRNPDVADRVERIHLHFTIKGAGIDEAKMPRIMELTAKNCSMVQSVKDSIDIRETYEVIR
ncbi:OsmC family protein [Bhargavaea beijingensis]|uniref:OsmC family protein n=1 Tax=Bhargavaea beijingensis TaxID=426756 RepID=UPI0022242D49|nr:OsmC family protein [Bhargavaea beijingensis]MCW1928430.1 OsmC family protein [Bhargavaea beijingensis]